MDSRSIFFRQLLILPLLFGYLFLSLFSLSHMGHMTDMGMAMIDCPYFPFQTTSGSDLDDHLSAWSSFVLVIASTLYIFGLIGISTLFNRLDHALLQADYHLMGSDSPPPRPPITQLFSSGILHPRIP